MKLFVALGMVVLLLSGGALAASVDLVPKGVVEQNCDFEVTVSGSVGYVSLAPDNYSLGFVPIVDAAKVSTSWMKIAFFLLKSQGMGDVERIGFIHTYFDVPLDCLLDTAILEADVS